MALQERRNRSVTDYWACVDCHSTPQGEASTSMRFCGGPSGMHACSAPQVWSPSQESSPNGEILPRSLDASAVGGNGARYL
jgi:hypothetical protein